MSPVKQILIKTRRAVLDLHPEHGYLEFHPRYISMLSALEIQIAFSYCVYEIRPDGSYLRELKVDATTPQDFVFDQDL